MWPSCLLLPAFLSFMMPRCNLPVFYFRRSEGELKSAKFLKAAGDMIASGSHAMQLRYLQTLGSIASENNSTIIFPVPIDLFAAYSEKKKVREECPEVGE